MFETGIMNRKGNRTLTWYGMLSLLLVLLLAAEMIPLPAYPGSAARSGAFGAAGTLEETAAALETAAAEVPGVSAQASSVSTAERNTDIPEMVRTGQVLITGENTERRTEYTKHFILDCGINMAVSYGEPVHYEEDGVWKEIDSTPVLSSAVFADTDGNTVMEDVYTNKAGKIKMYLPENMTEDSRVLVENEGYTLSFSMDLCGNGTAGDGDGTCRSIAGKASLEKNGGGYCIF